MRTVQYLLKLRRNKRYCTVLMTTVDFVTELFCKVDDLIGHEAKHGQANLYPSEVVTLALLYALTGKGQRADLRWLTRDYGPLFPNLPCRTRLFRLFNSHWHYIGEFMAPASMICVIDSYGEVAPANSQISRFLVASISNVR